MRRAAKNGTAGEAQPRDLTAEETAMTIGSAGDAVPTLTPPEEVSSSFAAGSMGVWTADHKVAALWLINQNRNSWIYLENVGWRKLADNSDSAIMALSILAAHAKQTQTPYYNGREEADGKIHECYVW